MTRTDNDCKGCRATVRVPNSEVQRLLDEYLRGNPQGVVRGDEAARRLAICTDCDDLQYGTTCRYCGCLVAVRTYLKDKQCPRPDGAKW